MASDPREEQRELKQEKEATQPVSRAGDVWLLDRHRLVCGAGGDVIGVDQAVKAWQTCAGKLAKLEANGRSYAEIKKDRGGDTLKRGARSRRRDGEV